VAAAPDLKALGRYRIDRVLGKGAMGVVYEGFDPRLNRRVAIKVILKAHLDEDLAKDYSQRFVREAQAVARLNHPNIVQVHDFGEEGDIAYLVLEYIEGKELKSFFDAKAHFEVKEAVRLMGELCDALEFAHNAGIVHRDVKPANVMIDSQGRAKLTDFGVARVQDVMRTQGTSTMVGTPAFMAPEQISGGSVDRRTDVFSAGIILYQFLTGDMPFTGSGTWTIAKKIMQDEPPRPSSVDASVTPLFDAVVNRALAKSPEGRYQSAREFAIALRRALDGQPAEDDSLKTIIAPLGGQTVATRPPLASRPPASQPATGTAALNTQGSQELELEYWRSIKDGNDANDFELYVQQFPNGVYATLAKRKIARLRRNPARLASRTLALLAAAGGVIAAVAAGVYFASSRTPPPPAESKSPSIEEASKATAAQQKAAVDKQAADTAIVEKAAAAATAEIAVREKARAAKAAAEKAAAARAADDKAQQDKLLDADRRRQQAAIEEERKQMQAKLEEERRRLAQEQQKLKEARERDEQAVKDKPGAAPAPRRPVFVAPTF